MPGFTNHPLTFTEVKRLFDYVPLFVVFSHDGSDAMIQDNGYSLKDCKNFIARGDEIYIDSKLNR